MRRLIALLVAFSMVGGAVALPVVADAAPAKSAKAHKKKAKKKKKSKTNASKSISTRFAYQGQNPAVFNAGWITVSAWGGPKSQRCTQASQRYCLKNEKNSTKLNKL